MTRLIDADDFNEQYGNYYAEEGPADGFIGTVGDLIAKQPIIDAEPVRHGWWVDWSMRGESAYQCSECDCEMKHKTNYCPRCGAKMDGADNG